MLSVIIISKNEEANIKRCLDSISWADEIVVLDSGSTDNTIAIAQKYTENVYTSEDWHGYGIQKQRVLNLATGDWVLNLDADESVSEHLRTAIKEAMESDEADAYRIPICMNFYDKPLRYSSSPKRHIRLFKREGARYSEDIVHEKVILPEEARIGKLFLPIMHRALQLQLTEYVTEQAWLSIQSQLTRSFLVSVKAKNYSVHAYAYTAKLAKQEATFRALPGLAPIQPSISLESLSYPGYFLHHMGADQPIKVEPEQAGGNWRKDATWKLVPALSGDPTCCSLESVSKLGCFAHLRGQILHLGKPKSQMFAKEASFQLTQPLSHKAPSSSRSSRQDILSERSDDVADTSDHEDAEEHEPY